MAPGVTGWFSLTTPMRAELERLTTLCPAARSAVSPVPSRPFHLPERAGDQVPRAAKLTGPVVVGSACPFETYADQVAP